ncbi:MAG TPA: MnhB domain-containing protein [Actinomycetota bacterium]|nr:MnhB domain-containing protein [Actinomycetota bacterium]
MSTLILRTAARLLVPLIGVLAVYLLVRGHDAPGGGFIAALAGGAAIVLRYLAHGPAGVRRLVPIPFSSLLGVGLLLAVGYGVAGLVAGAEFLRGAIWRVEAPVVGELKVAAALVFDLGVFFVVLGVVLAIVRYLGEER